MLHARPDYQDRIQDTSGKIPADEPVFLLRAQDQTSAGLVREWARRNEQIAGHDANAVKLALEHADKMDKWPVKKTADV